MVAYAKFRRTVEYFDPPPIGREKLDSEFQRRRYFPDAERHRTLAGIHCLSAGGRSWVGLSGWSETEVVYPPADGHPSQ